MKQFRNDNTEGYTDAQLATLNYVFEQKMLSYDSSEECDVDELRQIEKHVSECVLRDFDSGLIAE